jgi:hypothetical protein
MSQPESAWAIAEELMSQNMLDVPIYIAAPVIAKVLVSRAPEKEFCECGHVFRDHSVVRTSYCMMGGCQCLTFRPVERQPKKTRKA